MRDKFLIGVALAALSIGPAFAADMAVKAPPPPLAPVATWTGFYLGANVGGGWNTNDWSNVNSVLTTLNVGAPAGNGNANGILGGFQGGFNYQIGQKVVIGIEGEYDFADIRGKTFLKPRDFPGLGSTRERNIASVTGRIGALYHDDILIYVKGGWAWSQFRYDVSGTDGEGGVFSYPTVSDNRSGGTIGLGAEYRLDRNWTAKIEYDYYDFGTKTVSFPQGNQGSFLTSPFNVDIGQKTHVVKVGVNYLFNWLR